MMIFKLHYFFYLYLLHSTSKRFFFLLIHSFLSLWIHGFLFSLVVIIISIIYCWNDHSFNHQSFFCASFCVFLKCFHHSLTTSLLLAQDVLVQIMSFSCTCHGISHFSKEHEKLFGNSDSKLSTNWITIQKMRLKTWFFVNALILIWKPAFG